MKWIPKENEILILRTLNKFLKWILKRIFFRIVLCFINKRNQFEKNKTYESNTKPNERERNHKVELLTTEKIEVVRMEANLHYFSMASEK